MRIWTGKEVKRLCEIEREVRLRRKATEEGMAERQLLCSYKTIDERDPVRCGRA